MNLNLFDLTTRRKHWYEACFVGVFWGLLFWIGLMLSLYYIWKWSLP